MHPSEASSNNTSSPRCSSAAASTRKRLLLPLPIECAMYVLPAACWPLLLGLELESATDCAVL